MKAKTTDLNMLAPNRKTKPKISWEERVTEFFRIHNADKASGIGSASFVTRDNRLELAMQMFRTLRNKLNYMLDDPMNLKPKHVEALIKYWIEKGNSPATIDVKLSALRFMAGKADKGDIVKPLGFYAPNFRKEASRQESKDVKAPVDFWPLWEIVYQDKKDVGMLLLVLVIFQIPIASVLRLRPLIADKGNGTHIEIWDSANHGNPRLITLDTPLKRAVLAAACNYVMKTKMDANAFIGLSENDIDQNRGRFYNCLEKHGISRKSGMTAKDLVASEDLTFLVKHGLLQA